MVTPPGEESPHLSIRASALIRLWCARLRHSLPLSSGSDQTNATEGAPYCERGGFGDDIVRREGKTVRETTCNIREARSAGCACD